MPVKPEFNSLHCDENKPLHTCLSISTKTQDKMGSRDGGTWGMTLPFKVEVHGMTAQGRRRAWLEQMQTEPRRSDTSQPKAVRPSGIHK